MPDIKYAVVYTKRCEKQIKLAIKRGKKIEKLYDVVDLLRRGKKLPAKNHDHALTGEWAGFRDCHIEPDWVLIYCIVEEKLILELIQTGTHSDLFKN
ncbi:type II toxin-antitoxin system YafQ family toxin [Candidatus Saccharibacteria bacterium]|nr:type II toxin-antitoxin system YafQ family toxin [Candidatus Saccharibacteria bacterium]